jgi:hypothetical protein
MPVADLPTSQDEGRAVKHAHAKRQSFESSRYTTMQKGKGRKLPIQEPPEHRV